MKIQSINNNYGVRKPQHLNFKAFERAVVKPGTSILTEEILWRNNTSIYRNDMAWSSLVKFFKQKYADVEKVHVYNYACSNGLEAYTFLMELLSNSDEATIKKFTPVVARDFDSFAINIARQRIVDIEQCEIDRINLHTNGNFEKYFFKSTNIEGKYSPNDILTDLVDFQVADFTKEYQNLPKDNIILFARNFWPYLSADDKKNLPAKLYEHLGKNVTMLIGNFDFLNLGSRLFTNSGFKPTYIPNVYEK